MPDVPDDVLVAGNVDNSSFSMKIGIAFLYDYTWIDQDAANVAQVGVQEDTGEVRDARLTLRGDLKFFYDWKYQFTGQYKGFDQDPNQTDDWSFTDVFIAREFSFGTMTLGKQKQTYIYEMVGASANLPQVERLMNPFAQSRDIGVTLSNTMFDKRATWTVGVFQEKGTQATARLTAVPVWDDNSEHYLHLAVATRYNGSENGQLRFSGRPESDVTDLYVDTGQIPADHAWHFALEALWADGPFTVLAEYAEAHVSSGSTGDPRLQGWYVTGGWLITGGAPRPYDRNVGYARRIPVVDRHGQLELVGRFGRVDLDNGGVQGGTLDKWYAGLNWWATKRMKMSLGYGDAELERFGLDGNTKFLFTRFQWIN